MGKKRESGQTAEGGVVRAGGAKMPKGFGKNPVGPCFAVSPPTGPKLLEKGVGAGRAGLVGRIGQETGNAVEDCFAVERIGQGEEVGDGDGSGERGERFPIFGKAEALGQSDPGCLVEAVCAEAGLGEETALAQAMPTRFFENSAELRRGKGKEERVATARFFAACDLGGSGPEKGDELGQGRGQLMFEGDLADEGRGKQSGGG